MKPIKNRNIRVVVFGGGPVLEYGIKKFISLLEDHPNIDFLCAVCESKEQTLGAVIRDLWKRRKILAIPLLILKFFKRIRLYLVRPFDAYELNRNLSKLSNRIFFVPDIHAVEVLNQVRSLSPDLGLIYGSPIIKPELFEIPRLGTLGIHHGKVPEYRGKKTTFWAIYNGESFAGVTIQKVNPGLDTGEVVKQGEVSTARRSYGAIWSKLEALGFDLYLQAILEVKEGIANYKPQEGTKGKLYTDPKIADVLIFWSKQFIRRTTRS